MVEVEPKIAAASGGESIAMDTGALGCSEFGIDILIIKMHFIIARLCLLAFVAESRYTLIGSGGHKEDIYEVAGSGSAESGMAEPIDTAVVMVISRSIEPIGSLMGVGAELHHSEWNSGAGIVIA